MTVATYCQRTGACAASRLRMGLHGALRAWEVWNLTMDGDGENVCNCASGYGLFAYQTLVEIPPFS